MIQNYPNYPIDCIQSLIDPWWVAADKSTLVRGQLIKAFVPHVDQEPMALRPVGRKEATCHDLADCTITRVSIKDPYKHDDALPVAGLTCFSGECRMVLRAKNGPCW